MADAAPEQVTISKAEYDTLLGIRSMLDKGWNNKEKGSAFRRALKDAVPEARIPEDETDSVAGPIKKELEDLKASIQKDKDDKAAAEKADKEAKFEARMRDDIARVQKEYNFDEEGMKKVFERMREKNNPDVDAAAAFIAKGLPKPQTVTDSGIAPLMADTKSVFGAADGDDADMALLHKDPWAFFNKKVPEIINEGRQTA